MNRRLKKSCILVAVALLSMCLISCKQEKTFTSAKKECESFLSEHRVEMDAIAVAVLMSGGEESGEHQGHDYYSDLQNRTVTFDIDAQGMLGGQYWSLIYSESGVLHGETDIYLYEEDGGNNVVRAERLDDHWWYCWEDYDGRDLSYQ